MKRLGRAESGRTRYDSARWRRVDESPWWRWVVGPLAYMLVVVGVGTSVLGMSVPAAIAVAGVAPISAWLTGRRSPSETAAPLPPGEDDGAPSGAGGNDRR